MNFIIFLGVPQKLFSFCFVPLRAPNPGDATVLNNKTLTANQTVKATDKIRRA